VTSNNRSDRYEWQDRRGGSRLKEAAGALTGNDRLARRQTDQAVGKVKKVAEKAVDKVKQAREAYESEVVTARERAQVCLGRRRPGLAT